MKEVLLLPGGLNLKVSASLTSPFKSQCDGMQSPNPRVWVTVQIFLGKAKFKRKFGYVQMYDWPSASSLLP